MRRLAVLLVAVLATLLLMPAFASAADFRSGADVVIGPNETIDADLYLTGSTIRVEGTVRGDVFATGQTVIISGRVDGGVSAASATVEISGQVSRGVRAAAGSVRVSGQIQRDLIAFAGLVEVVPGGGVGGDLVASGGTLTLAGQVGGSVWGQASTATIAGTVGGNVDLDTESLTIGPNARIAGTLQYRSNQNANIASGAQVATNRGRTAPAGAPAPSPLQTFLGMAWGFFRAFLGILVLGALWLLLLPRSLRSVAGTLAQSPLPSLGIGVLTLLIVPVALIALLVLAFFLGQMPLLMVITALLILGLAVAGTIVSFWSGGTLLRWAKQPGGDWLKLVLGALVVTLLGAIPFVGGLVGLVVAVFGFGAAALAIVRSRGTTPATAAA